MTKERAYELLCDIRDQVDAQRYPETMQAVLPRLDEEGNVYGDLRELVDQLYGTDATEQMPSELGLFLIEYYVEAIQNGDADAACDFGSLFYSGRIGEQSYQKAMEYYTIAADGGSRQAQENLGYCYYYGRDCEVDYEKAFHYFALGAFDGHLNSLYKIGDMYRYGYYVRQNGKEAFAIYEKCLQSLTPQNIELVGADIMLRMADCFREGIGTDPDAEQALAFYQRAEQLFYKRLKDGDFMIAGNYKRSVRAQEELRKQLAASLPDFDWTK